SAGRSRAWLRGQGDDEMRPSLRGLGPDAAAVRLREAARDRQAEPSPAGTAGRGPMERLEDDVSVCRRDPRPTVDHMDAHLAVAAFDRDADGSGRRRVLERVLDQANEDALDLRGVDTNRWHALLQRARHARVG